MKKILIGITGGIAAYKMPQCIRLLKKSGFDVRVVMTNAAEKFVTPITLAAVLGEKIYQSLWSESTMSHIELARWADVILIAPATANFIAKLTYGIADDLLSTLCVSATVPIMLAPAMNREMWLNAATQGNIKTCLKRGMTILGPGKGEQACGEVGPGRMLEPEEIVSLLKLGSLKKILSGLNILITAGPTREPVDAIRYLSNRSSGRMGYALAQAAYDLGANVTLISGPTNLEVPPVNVIAVKTAAEMFEAVMQTVSQQQMFISAAAVADYTPKVVETRKIQKGPGDWSLELTRTQDILAAVSSLDTRPFCIGFAAESENCLENARKKLKSKKLDMIVANKIQDSFDQVDNSIAVLTADGQSIEFKRQSKRALSYKLLNFLHESRQAMTGFVTF